MKKIKMPDINMSPDRDKYAIISLEDCFYLNKRMVELWGWQKAGWMVTLLSRWQDLKNKNKLEKDGSFFLTHAEQMRLIPDLSEYKIIAYKKFFKEIEALETQMRGLPSKEFYLLSHELIRFWKEGRGD